MAAEGGHGPIVEVLLDNGADVNDGDALQVASLGGHESLARLLINNGADVNCQGGAYGHTFQAVSCKSHELVMKLLIDNGADVMLKAERTAVPSSRLLRKAMNSQSSCSSIVAPISMPKGEYMAMPSRWLPGTATSSW